MWDSAGESRRCNGCRLASAGLEQYSRFETASELYTVFEKMEPLDSAWPERRDGMDEILYGAGKEVYESNRRAFLAANGTRMELLREQIMVYFVFGYFCGAVAATILVEELLMAEWLREDLPEKKIVDLVHCFSREVEHSDENRGLLEDELVKREEFRLKALLAAVIEWKRA